LRKSRGVWYTPQPVVNFIVRAVDDILKTEFDLPQGLADTSKTTIKVNTQTADKRSATGYKQMEQEVHKVQILDPATGTGTFLAEVVKHIHKKFQGQEGIWSNYVESHLLPRLNGFELLMASYAMAHLKLDLLLTETGFKPTSNQRFKVYLTNSLEEHHQDTGTLFANWLSTEANEANHIKRDTPVMCVIGNPPYSGESANKGEWIMSLMDDYKKEPGGKEKLKEQNSKFINDDYVKFLRYGQHLIEKNGSGVLAFINPHGYLDNPTFRGMRWHLLKTYDKIYTIDLHGNSKKKETAPDGSADINVFDIQQGVSINVFVKTGKKKANELGKVYHYDLFGKRDFKYDFLKENSLKSIVFSELINKAPNYFMVEKDFELEDTYRNGFSVVDLFNTNSLGIQTHRDALSIDESKNELAIRIKEFFDLSIEDDLLKSKYGLKENKEWKLKSQREGEFIENKIVRIDYRPFDSRFLYYDRNIVDRLRDNISKHFIQKENICLIVPRQCVSDWRYALVSKNIIESNLTGTAGRFGSGNFFPLYLYPDTNGQQTIEQSNERKPNLKAEIVNQIAEQLGLTFTNEKETTENTFAPIDILDYIYAVLHSPTYRETYNEFLKIDFPRVPYPKDQDTFWQLVKLGGEIRQIHLLESTKVEQYITQYPIDGDNVVDKPKYKDGKVYINATQYFDNVPQLTWEFYIGGYQPAQKWLKDRKDRKLEFDDISHYQKIIVALTETDRLMKEIDKIEII
jgi:predicted helicase